MTNRRPHLLREILIAVVELLTSGLLLAGLIRYAATHRAVDCGQAGESWAYYCAKEVP